AVGLLFGVDEDGAQAAHGMHDHGKGKLKHHGAERTAKADHGGSGLDNLPQIAPFDEQSCDDSAQREEDPAKAGLIHAYLSGSGPPGWGDLAIKACADVESQLTVRPRRTDRRNSII